MNIRENNGKVAIEGLTPFEAQTLLRCVSAIGHNLRDSGFELYPVYTIDDQITEVAFSEDEMKVLEKAVQDLQLKLEKRPCLKYITESNKDE